MDYGELSRGLTNCGKNLFATKTDARRARKIARMKVRGSPPLYLYFCSKCSGYHLTKQKQFDG